MMMNKKPLLIVLISLLLAGCFKVPNRIDPKISTPVSEKFIKSLKNPFPLLTSEERNSDWGKEYLIAIAFAQKMDLYQAILTFKRADILIPADEEARKQEIQYFMLLCYYLGKKYQNVIETFEESTLPTVSTDFNGFHDLLLMLYQSYNEMEEREKAEKIKTIIDSSFPESAEELTLAQALLDANFPKIREISKKDDYNYLTSFLNTYESKKKSIPGAQALNAIIPGAGYFYLGQKKSALTSFLLNGLFIYASYEFFHRGYIAAGIITLSFETGWYFGGIYGGGEAAKYYNERLYDEEVKKVMNQKQMYPIFMLRYAF